MDCKYPNGSNMVGGLVECLEHELSFAIQVGNKQQPPDVGFSRICSRGFPFLVSGSKGAGLGLAGAELVICPGSFSVAQALSARKTLLCSRSLAENANVQDFNIQNLSKSRRTA